MAPRTKAISDGNEASGTDTRSTSPRRRSARFALSAPSPPVASTSRVHVHGSTSAPVTPAIQRILRPASARRLSAKAQAGTHAVDDLDAADAVGTPTPREKKRKSPDLHADEGVGVRSKRARVRCPAEPAPSPPSSTRKGKGKAPSPLSASSTSPGPAPLPARHHSPPDAAHPHPPTPTPTHRSRLKSTKNTHGAPRTTRVTRLTARQMAMQGVFPAVRASFVLTVLCQY
ncbi:hypothetical protein K438DRAFT_1283987 [Mycena galopus ATCC 62051]|nr:hypothetical protein K438DRAFT_1283987 [Mycena galopus ATCC 62051]